jgi:hypothetical protein
MPVLFPVHKFSSATNLSNRTDRLPRSALKRIFTSFPTTGNPQPPQLNDVCGDPSGNYPIIWNYAALLSLSVTKFNLIGAMFPHLQQPATLPQHRVSSDRSLFLRSLCPAASGSANIIHII